MELLRDFKKISKSDISIAGGKGASLGEMTQAGIPVPPGFVLLSEAFEKFLEETDLNVEIDSILHTVDHREMHTVEGASEKIQSLIKEAQMPNDIAEEIEKNFKKLGAKFVAVRSSATAEDSSEAAWAGQLDSYLNTTEDKVLENVQRCWASLFTPRAIFYRFEKELHRTKISVAVVIQKMVESEISGIAFSVHPVTEDRNQLIIEAGLGLGEAIVSGQITPDSYVVEKNSSDGEPGRTTRRIIDKNISEQDRGLYRLIRENKRIVAKEKDEESRESGNEWVEIQPQTGSAQKLSDAEILELTELILKIENHYGFPCDIEWAYEKSKFYITQSRPITTLSLAGSDAVEDVKEVWVNNASIEKASYQVMSPVIGFGMKVGEEAFDGRKKNRYLSRRFYLLNGRKLEGMYYPENDLSDFAEDILEFIYTQPDRVWNNHSESYSLNARLFDRSKELSKTDFSKYSNDGLAQLYMEFTELQEKAHAYSLATTWFVDSTGGLFANKLLENTKDIVDRNNSKLNPSEVFTVLTTPEKESFAIQEELASLQILKKIAEDPKAKKVFEELASFQTLPSELNQEIGREILDHFEKWRWVPFGYTGPAYNLDYYLSIWSGLIKENFNAASAILQLQNRKSEILKQKDQIVKELKISEKDKTIYDIAADMTFLKGYRKDCSYMCFYAHSFLAKEIVSRMNVTEEQLSLLTYVEIYKLLRGEMKFNTEETEKRKGKAIMLPKNELDFEVIVGPDAEEFLKDKVIKKEEIDIDADAFKGNCASSGHAKGIVKIINKPEEMGKMNQGDIMVAHTTFPSLVPAMKKAVAIITEDGGITCHAAIVARELKTPCVTGIKTITQVLKDGDEIEVDADNGLVRMLKKS